MANKWKQILGMVAPVAGSLLGGPLGGIAGKAIAVGLGLAEDASDAAIEKAVLAADPSQLAVLRQIDADLQRDLEQAEIDYKSLDVKDRASARAMAIKIGAHAQYVLAAVVVVGFFSVLGAMIFLEIPESSQQPINILLGALTGMMLQVGNFFFGSSAGSKRKTEMLG